MKKVFLLSIGAALSISAFAQSASVINKAHVAHKSTVLRSVNRTTVTYHDSLLMSNGIFNNALDTPFSYITSSDNTADSGYLFGTSNFGLNGFAQRYDFNSADSSVEVLGIVSLFAGVVNPGSSNSVTFNAWSMAAPTVSSSTITYSGFPNTVLASVTVPFTQLGISDTALTYTANFFTTPTSYLTSSFFVGYTMNYDWTALAGDTITVLATDFRNQSADTVIGGDTIINDQNVCYELGASASGWLDNGFDIGINSEYYMFAIVTTKNSLGFKGITKNNFTFYGNYPNPTSDNTNIKFSLATNTDVTITIMDMAGHVVNTINQTNLAAGTHITSVSTANLAAGDYIYLVRTAAGDGMASKMTVIK